VKVEYTHEIPMGHRLQNHGGRCRQAHGHNYVVCVGYIGIPQRATGMIIDFSELKRAVRRALEPYDHAFVLQGDDPLAATLIEYADVILLPEPPTAEVLAVQWRHDVAEALDVPDDNLSITVYETRDCAVSL
jgi:6-pyruvoyltetrahydropterin/6-carboxytetrahydropterin synthase